MMHFVPRLELLIEIGLLAAQARTYTELDKQLRLEVALDSQDGPRYLESQFLWDEASFMISILAEIDVRTGVTPKANPMLSEFGLLEEYWKARSRIDLHPDPDDFDDC
ncbi:hypothetical protein PSH66_04445 [Pseudomonas sp. FP597]|uniref:hypothetical protein n=1 Tax=Pseudomonas sp. FP597 TaxID=2954096 RepID=UPI00273276CB|nr:hypothetical protein [Pseudomonas sp. FP597]WLI07586.1 hypothetical protein PSH66_04445 [Pseudomonas sp. FP597]